jgi:hypothetical protein
MLQDTQRNVLFLPPKKEARNSLLAQLKSKSLVSSHRLIFENNKATKNATTGDNTAYT